MGRGRLGVAAAALLIGIPSAHAEAPQNLKAKAAALVDEQAGLARQTIYVRDRFLKDIDAALCVHVKSKFTTGLVDPGNTGMVSADYRSTGEAVRAALVLMAPVDSLMISLHQFH